MTYAMSKTAECNIPLLANFPHIPGVRDGFRSALSQELALTESNLAYASSWTVTSTRLVEALQRESKESYGLIQPYIHGQAFAHNRQIPPLAVDESHETSKLYGVASSESREAQPTVEAIGSRMILFQERLRKFKGAVSGLLTKPSEAGSLMIKLNDAGQINSAGEAIEPPGTADGYGYLRGDRASVMTAASTTLLLDAAANVLVLHVQSASEFKAAAWLGHHEMSVNLHDAPSGVENPSAADTWFEVLPYLKYPALGSGILVDISRWSASLAEAIGRDFFAYNGEGNRPMPAQERHGGAHLHQQAQTTSRRMDN
eukprot:1611241-Amphidinium_carterae.1